MEGQFAVPFHFAAEFLVLVVAAGAAATSIGLARGRPGVRAYSQAAGFIALGAAELAHGALFITAEASLPLIALRTAGFGLIAISVPSHRPVRSDAAAAPAIFVAGTAAWIAVLPGAAALAAAARGALRLRDDRASASFAFAAAFACFAAGEFVLAPAGPSGGTALVVVHALRAAGAILLGRWLWASVVNSLRLRLATIFVVALVAMILVVSASLNVVMGRTIESQELDRVAEAGRALSTTLDDRTRTAAQHAQLLAGLPTVADAFRGAYPASAACTNLSCLAARAFTQLLDVDFFLFVDARPAPIGSALVVRSGGRVATSAIPQALAIPLAGGEEISAALTDRATHGSVETVGPDRVAVVGATGVYGAPGKPLGAVVVGYWVDDSFLASSGNSLAAEVSLVVAGEGVASTIQGAGDALARCSAAEVRTVVEENGEVLRSTCEVGGTRYFSAFLPVKRPQGDVIGVLVLSRPTTIATDAERNMTRTLFLVTLFGAGIAVALSWTAGGRVTRPIRSLRNAAEGLRLGDLHARAAVDAADEVGELGATFNEMAGSLERMTGDLREAALQEAGLRSRMEAIMQSMGDGLIAVDARGHVVAFNKAAEEMVGRTQDRVLGRPLSQVLAGHDGSGRPLVEAAMDGAGAGDGVLTRSSGDSIPVALTSAPLLDHAGAVVGRVMVFRDTSAQAQAERMKSEFLSNVSHELRTPLTPIKGYTEILRRKQFPRKKSEEFLDGILASTARLERVVEILVDFAALEAGRLIPKTEPIALGHLVAERVERWRGRGVAHRFVVKVPASLPPVEADRRLLERCLDELLDNAVKFSPKGGRVDIVAEAVADKRRARGPAMVRLQVRDSGIGIPPDLMPKLFQDFRQLDGSETREFGGLGLGLAYVKRIAVSHGGDVFAESRPGRGSVFSLLLPAAGLASKKGQAKAKRPGRVRR